MMNIEHLTDAAYLGFIQGLCWTNGSDGNNPLTFNEPDNIWVHNEDGGNYYEWDRARFLNLFADFDEGPIFYLQLLTDGSWVIYSTESDDCPTLPELEDLGFACAHELADRG